MNQTLEEMREKFHRYGKTQQVSPICISELCDIAENSIQAREEWLKGEIEKKLAKARDYYQETRLQPLEGEMSAFRDVLSLINKK